MKNFFILKYYSFSIPFSETNSFPKWHLYISYYYQAALSLAFHLDTRKFSFRSDEMYLISGPTFF